MVRSTSSSSSSSSSSCACFSSLEEVSVKSPCTVKFLCSYGGKIVPRYPDGKLRYLGGDTRVLAVERSVSHSELVAKMRELCGWSEVHVRCQLPTEDLDALVSVTSDEDLANLIEEYDRASAAAVDRVLPLKIRTFLLPPPPSSKPPSKSPTATSPPATPVSGGTGYVPLAAAGQRCVHQISVAAATRVVASRYEKPAVATGEVRFHGGHHHHHQPVHHHHHHGHHASPRPFLVHHGNHWQ